MTNPRHPVAPYASRLESTKYNRGITIANANLLALGAAILQGDSAYYGVVSGMTVTATGVDLNVTIASGLALRSGTGVDSDHSDTMWIELVSSAVADLSSHVDGGNPRWVVVEIAEGEEDEAVEAVAIFNSVTGSFTASTTALVQRPAPVVTTRAGTAAATPVFPSGTAGVIPLAYVYLTAGALTINATDIVMCRPMLRGDVGGDQPASGRDVWGGGVTVAAAGLDVVMRNAGGRFASHRVKWGFQALDGTTAYTLAATGMDGAALPVADDVVYFYAAPAPYPSGYDSSLAPREHRPGATALTRYQGMVTSDLYNAVIVASTVEPQVDSPQGSPTAGNFTMTCAPFQAAATIDRTTTVYLGATFWDFSAGDLLVQDFRSSWVVPEVPTSVDVDAGGAATYSLWNNVSGVGGVGDMLFPVSALRVGTMVALRDNAQNSGTTVQVRITDEALGTFGAGLGWLFSIANDAAVGTSVDLRTAHVFEVERGTGNVTVNAVAVDASDNVHLYGASYEDCILAAR